LRSYCIFCRSGSERSIAAVINGQDNPFTAISPRRVVRENRKGKWVTRDMSLLPGYVFLYTEEERPNVKVHAKDLYRILQYESGIRSLQDGDEQYALWVYRNHGKIGISRLIDSGDQVTVIDGPLKDCHGKILRIDKHKRRAIVEFEIFEKKRQVSLSVETLHAHPPETLAGEQTGDGTPKNPTGSKKA
jgi:transcription termination/antitermination protein NusG